jgi:hypothetical protein
MRQLRVILSAFIAIIVLCVAPALAATCNIRGTVTDAAGNPVQGASVTIFDSNRAEVSTINTNAAGQFSFTSLRINTDLFTVRVFYNDYQRTYTNPSYFFTWYPASGDQTINSSDTRLDDLRATPFPSVPSAGPTASPGLSLLAGTSAVLVAACISGLFKRHA